MGLQSPRFRDGSFEFVPIPEHPSLLNLNEDVAGASYLVRYGNLKCFNRPEEPLSRYLSPRVRQRPTHHDPEFETFSYGDVCATTPRAAALKQMQPGDWLFFLARLADYDEGADRFTGTAAFYLIGYLEIAQILAEVRGPLSQEELSIFGHNAHVRRAQVLPNLFYDGFYIFKGSARSKRFQVAHPFGRAEADVYLRAKAGHLYDWKEGRSELQTLGSYTRTCRCILHPARSNEEAERAAAFLGRFG